MKPPFRTRHPHWDSFLDFLRDFSPFIIAIGAAVLLLGGVVWLTVQSDKKTERQNRVSSVRLVESYCGRDSARLFKHTYEFTSPWDLPDAADKWVKVCPTGILKDVKGLARP